MGYVRIEKYMYIHQSENWRSGAPAIPGKYVLRVFFGEYRRPLSDPAKAYRADVHKDVDYVKRPIKRYGQTTFGPETFKGYDMYGKTKK